MEVTTKTLYRDVRLHLIPMTNLKTTLIKIFFHWPLGHKTGQMALVPKVLERGPKDYTSTLEFQRDLEEMYGTEFFTGVHKKGERQLIEFRMEQVSEEFLLEQERKSASFEKGIELISHIIFNPKTEGDAFIKERVDIEKENQIDRLKKKDDKINYSVERLLTHMCHEEPFGMSKYGTEAEISGINPNNLFSCYKNLMNSALMDIFIVGNFPLGSCEQVIEKTFPLADRENVPDFSVEVNKEVTEPKEVIEQEQISQGKLCLGYRTQTSMKDQNIYPLMLFNGILGGFSHSKLFQVVREQNGLCYYIFSRLEKSKGIMVVNAGIDPEDYGMTSDLIDEEVKKIYRGEFTDNELDMAKTALISALQQIEDHPDSICETVLEGVINNKLSTPEEIRENLYRVTREQITEVAKNISLDTVYMLADKKKEKAGVNNDS